MRIALGLSTPLPAREGIGTYAMSLARRLRGEGHDVVLFTRGGLRPSVAQVDGFTVVRPRFLPVHPLHVHLHAGPMRRALARHGPFDVVHLHSPLPPPAFGTGTKVLTLHTPMAVDVRMLRWGEPKALLARLQLPVSVRLERRLLADADAITVVSPSVAKELREVYGTDAGRIHVVPNGVDAASIAPSFSGRQGGDLLYVGRLAARKGLPDLVAAMALLPASFRLHVVGEGPLRAGLERTVRARGLQERVLLHGFLPKGDLMRLWQQATVFVHVPSYEGMPTSLLEAMAHGVPVVTTDAPGTRDVITDGRTGRLVRVRDPAGLAEAVRELAGDPAQRERLARAARDQVERHHDWARLGKRMLDVYAGAGA